MKNKILSTIIIIIICFLIFAFADYLFAKKRYNLQVKFLKENFATEEMNKLEHNMWDYPFVYNWKKYPFEKLYNKQYKGVHRQFGDAMYQKRPILVFGCSFAEGAFLDYKEKFEYLLSNMTRRYVYNMGYSGIGPAVLLFQTQNQKMYDLINITTPDNPPEYAIYLYVNLNEDRIYNDKYALGKSDMFQIGYNQKNGKLVKGENPLIAIITRFAIGKYLVNEYVRKKLINKEYLGPLMKKYIIQSKEELQKRYPDIKFIIIIYPSQISGRKERSYCEDIWPELEKEGFIIYDLSKNLDVDIRTQEYLLPDTHPNAKSWQVVTPKIVKDLKL